VPRILFFFIIISDGHRGYTAFAYFPPCFACLPCFATRNHEWMVSGKNFFV